MNIYIQCLSFMKDYHHRDKQDNQELFLNSDILDINSWVYDEKYSQQSVTIGWYRVPDNIIKTMYTPTYQIIAHNQKSFIKWINCLHKFYSLYIKHKYKKNRNLFKILQDELTENNLIKMIKNYL